MIKKFIKYYTPHKKLFILDLLCAFLMAICDLFYPMITRNIINDYVPNKKLNFLIVWCIVLLVIYLIKKALTYFLQYWGHVVGVRMQADMRRDIFTHLQNLPFKFFDENKTGVIMSRIVNDLMDISELAHHGPEDLFISLIMILGSFIILCTINIPLTLITFAFIPLLIWFAIKKRIKMSDAFTETRVRIANVNASLENSIAGHRVSKAFVNEDYEIKKFEKDNMNFKVAREYAYKAMAEFFSGMNFIIDFLNLAILSLGGYFTYKGIIDLGDYVAYLLYITMFMNPIKRLINFVEQLQSGMTGFKRFCEIMDVEEEKDSSNAKDINDIQGDILFDNVTFKYDDEEKRVLNRVNLHIKAGKTIALVGPSGGGKTTLCNLLPRFYDIDSGKITIDGIDISTVTRKSLRKQIGIVQQDVFLFTGTILENILYGNPNASNDEIINAAKKANIHDFIMNLPEDYNTYIGEKGLKLSGGQKQRLSIARVFLKNPKILILDEATSALDNITESIIQKSLDELVKGRTTLIVAHRLSTIKNADEIIVLTETGIEERGTHTELLNNNGFYADLYNAIS
ncbi:ABC transporter ATP-binding protein [Clostridium novyi]|uniref:ABC transporter n=1 Tax=Clostridium novyi (strain NT) TaxID=386415 RepID=A0Q3A4_CLONN|nr:ABC transporter ATP-binding protein [Clostridium novyi]ABK62566.1 ABC transporter [Clostridium novyi NT]KEH86558.1 thiamine ABC transporter permease [Clostridium novyi A str. 4540]KEH87562.1 thiamine ABC transporter permease [Clostridium novyi A str. NCTC 538]KEH92749.1 thiamine ABC transporter permease [Clostridium novyi A str. GD211209]